MHIIVIKEKSHDSEKGKRTWERLEGEEVGRKSCDCILSKKKKWNIFKKYGSHEERIFELAKLNGPDISAKLSKVVIGCPDCSKLSRWQAITLIYLFGRNTRALVPLGKTSRTWATVAGPVAQEKMGHKVTFEQGKESKQTEKYGGKVILTRTGKVLLIAKAVHI